MTESQAIEEFKPGEREELETWLKNRLALTDSALQERLSRGDSPQLCQVLLDTPYLERVAFAGVLIQADTEETPCL